MSLHSESEIGSLHYEIESLHYEIESLRPGQVLQVYTKLIL